MNPSVPHLKNLYAEPSNEVYRDLRICTKPMDSCGITCGSDFLAAPWEVGGGGVIGVLRLTDTIRNPPIMKLKGHTAPILDLSFNPSYDSVIASCSEDLTIRVWDLINLNDMCYIDSYDCSTGDANNKINGFDQYNDIYKAHKTDIGSLMDKNTKTVDIKECLCILKGHKKKVTFIHWNARSPYILASTGFDGQVNIWDIENEKMAFQLNVPKKLTSLKWNVRGGLLSGTCINKNVHVVDPRMKNICTSFKAHTGGRMAKCTWIDGLSGNDDYVLSTGFTKESIRELKLWDLKNTSEPIDIKHLDNSAAPLFPFYDETIGVIYVVGKGDGNCRYFQHFNGTLQKIGEYRSNLPFKSFGFMPKQICNTRNCELGKVYKNENNDSIKPISFCVPRKNASEFQEDLYPPLITEDFYNETSNWVEGKDEKIRRTSINELTQEHLKPPKRFKEHSPTNRGSIIIQNSSEDREKKFFMRQITKTYNFIRKNTEHYANSRNQKADEKHGLDGSSEDTDDAESSKMKQDIDFYREEAKRNKELIKKLQDKIRELEDVISNKETETTAGSIKLTENSKHESEADTTLVEYEQNTQQYILQNEPSIKTFNEVEENKEESSSNVSAESDTHKHKLKTLYKNLNYENQNLNETQETPRKIKFNNFITNMKNFQLFKKKNCFFKKDQTESNTSQNIRKLKETDSTVCA